MFCVAFKRRKNNMAVLKPSWHQPCPPKFPDIIFGIHHKEIAYSAKEQGPLVKNNSCSQPPNVVLWISETAYKYRNKQIFFFSPSHLHSVSHLILALNSSTLTSRDSTARTYLLLNVLSPTIFYVLKNCFIHFF